MLKTIIQLDDGFGSLERPLLDNRGLNSKHTASTASMKEQRRNRLTLRKYHSIETSRSEKRRRKRMHEKCLI